MFQKTIIVGYLGQDPILRYTSSGKAVTNLSVATSNKFTTADGVKHEETTWWKVAVWGKQADACKQYLSKGQQVVVEGRMAGSKVPNNTGGVNVVPTVFTGQDGVARASFEITASNVRFGKSNGKPVTAPDDPDDWEREDDSQIPF